MPKTEQCQRLLPHTQKLGKISRT